MVTLTREHLAEGIRRGGWAIGEHTYGPLIVGGGRGSANLSVGKYCSIAAGAKVMLGGNHRVDWVSTYPFNMIEPSLRHITGHPATKGDVVIGNDVWLGNSCTILSGIMIGDGAVIALGSIVTRDVPAYAIVGGNPARHIKYRFTPEQIAALDEIRWWDWPHDRVIEYAPLLMSDEIGRFITAARASPYAPATQD